MPIYTGCPNIVHNHLTIWEPYAVAHALILQPHALTQFQNSRAYLTVRQHRLLPGFLLTPRRRAVVRRAVVVHIACEYDQRE